VDVIGDIEMSIVHITTQVNGGAGAFAVSVHTAMQKLGLSSLLLTRERCDIENTVTIKPLNSLLTSFHHRRLSFLEKLGLINNKYAAFSIEKYPVRFEDIQSKIDQVKPEALVFYWISYFVSFKCMDKLRQLYPDIPFVLICLDEAFLTGGCHYTWGCNGYMSACTNCPSTWLSHRKKRIVEEFNQRVSLIPNINPVVLYPTTNLQKMGIKSEILKNLRSEVVYLGAVSEGEIKSSQRTENTKLSILVRSSSEHRKGCDLFIDAIRSIGQTMPDLRSMLKVISIGDSTINDSGIDNIVEHRFMGLVARSELIDIYSQIDVLVVSSREDAGPIMINECVALGKFIISTNVGIAPDLIKNHVNGLVLKEKTVDSMRGALSYLVLNSSECLKRKNEYIAANTDKQSLSYEWYANELVNIINSNAISG